MDRYATLRNGLIGAWCPSVEAGGSLLADRSQRLNHGTLVGGPTWAAAPGGRALQFGSNQYVDCGSLNGEAFDYPFAACCWIRNVTNNDTSPFSKTKQDDSYSGWMIYIIGGKAVAFWRGGTRATSVKTVTNNSKWQHVLIQWTGSVAEVWIDGVRDVQSNTTTAPSAAATNVSVGRYTFGSNGSGDRSIVGQVDDCRVYKRVLTASEIALLASQRGIGLLPRRHRRAKVLGPQFWLNLGGTWRKATPFIKVAGEWEQATPKLNVGGTWK